MDDEPEQGSMDAAACPIGKITDIGQGADIRKYADAPTARVSLREKLGEMKARADGGDIRYSSMKEHTGMRFIMLSLLIIHGSDH